MSPAGRRAPTANGIGNRTPAATNWTAIISSTRFTTILCADTDAERERVREVVRDVTDHLLTHHYVLIDHDGKPTRWGVYGPQYLNHEPLWWQERGLKSLSMLSYLAVAEHVYRRSKVRGGGA